VGGGWEETTCACGASDATALFDVETPQAPSGRTRIVRCSACGLRRLTPRPDADALRAFYGDQYYAYGGRRRSPRKQALWELLRDIAAGVRRAPAAIPGARRLAARRFDVNVPVGDPSVRRVVDVGCGFGDLLLYLRSRGCSVIGVEYDHGAAAKGREYGLDIHVGDIRELRLRDASVDAAVLQHSLEHVPDPSGLIAELGRILRPGGTLHLALPNGDAAGLSGEREAWGCLFNPEHFWYFDRENLIGLLGRNGFVVGTVSHTVIWRNHWRLFRAEQGSAGSRAALRRIGRFLIALARKRRAGGDILRGVFVRV
jgi:SAM-dependent methyltransferase